MADLKISELPALSGALLQASDPLAIADLSASETKKITAGELAAGLGPLFPAGSINSSAVSVTISAGSIGTTELAAGSVTAQKLADDSSTAVGVTLPAAGAFIGQLAVETTGNTAHVWTGAAWVPFKAGGSINTIGFDNTVGVVDLAGTVSGDSVTLSAVLEPTTAAAQFLAGPTGAAGAVGHRAILGTDLPTASATEKGAVQVSGNGLRMNGSLIEIDNTITATTAHGVVTVNANGLVNNARPIASGDLPLATNAAAGVVLPGTGLEVGPTGLLGHPSLLAGGTFPKVTVNATGHVTAGSALLSTDIPNLDASKITGGTFAPARIADGSVTSLKLADYATSYIQDTQPAGAAHYNGQLWLNPLAQQIRMWDGNVWVPIGVGALSEQNLRFCGLFDASDGKIKILTKFGTDAGFNVGDVVPTATEQLTGAYFVCETAGNGTAVTPGVNYDAGDWIVCLGVAQGWERVDTLNGGGGGGGSLDSLADVTITTPGAGQVLTYNGANWINQTIPSASEAVKGIIQLATDAEVKAGTDALKTITPKTLADNYLAKNIANLPALP